jgi:hypothetical protein
MGCLIASVSVAAAQNICELVESNVSFQPTQSSNVRKISNQSGSGITSSATSIRKECQLDGYASEIVEKSLELFNTILAVVRQSTRAGGHILQNYIMMGAWVLTKGLLLQIDSTLLVSGPKKTKEELAPEASDLKQNSTNATSDLAIAKQGFSVLSVALGSQALTLTAMLIEDLTSEVKDSEDEKKTMEPANVFDLFHPFMATQRIALILQSTPFIPLLFHVAMISYGKAGDLIKSITFNKNLESMMSPEISKQLNNAIWPGETALKTPSLATASQKPPLIKPGKPKDPSDRSRNRRGGRSMRPAQRRVGEDDSTGEEDEEDDEEDSDEDDTDENEMAQNRTEHSDESDNEEEDDPQDEDDDSEPLLGKWFEKHYFPKKMSPMIK